MDNIDRQNIEPRQIIVIRKDLNMPSGKLAAQVSHASLGCILKLANKENTEETFSLNLQLNQKNKSDKAVIDWLNFRFTKVVLYVKSEEKLVEIYEKAKLKGLNTVIIEDAGFTCFDGVVTKTCIGIGPCYKEDLIGVTEKLQLLKD